MSWYLISNLQTLVRVVSLIIENTETINNQLHT